MKTATVFLDAAEAVAVATWLSRYKLILFYETSTIKKAFLENSNLFNSYEFN